MLLQNEHVLITGGTGSLGHSILSTIHTGHWGTPKRLVVYSRDEEKQHSLQRKYPDVECIVGDIRDSQRMYYAVQSATMVIHAAALKQVPSCEYAVSEAVKTNVIGAQNIVDAVVRSNNTHTAIAVSTDKACKPVNVMGMTKALQERTFIAGNLISDTRFNVVRYGNVMGSRGSLLPVIADALLNKRDITITHSAMTRFMLSLKEAGEAIYAAIANGKRGQTFIPVCPSAQVADIIAALCPNGYPTKVSGIRPGEKLHEILISEEESHRTTTHPQWFTIESCFPELAQKMEPATSLWELSSGAANNLLSTDATKTWLKERSFI